MPTSTFQTTHRNLANVIAMIESAFAKLTPGKDVILNVLPYYHIYGMYVHTIGVLPCFCVIGRVERPRRAPKPSCLDNTEILCIFC